MLVEPTGSGEPWLKNTGLDGLGLALLFTKAHSFNKNSKYLQILNVFYMHAFCYKKIVILPESQLFFAFPKIEPEILLK